MTAQTDREESSPCDSWSYFYFIILYVKLHTTMYARAVFVFNRGLCNRVLSGYILTRSVSAGFEVLAGNHIISCQHQQWKWTRAHWWRNDFMNGWQRSHQMAEPLCFGSSGPLWLVVETSQVQDWIYSKFSLEVNIISLNWPQLLNCGLAVTVSRTTGYMSSAKKPTCCKIQWVNLGLFGSRSPKT